MQFLIQEHLYFAFSAYFGVFIFILEYVTNVIYTCTFSSVQFHFPIFSYSFSLYFCINRYKEKINQRVLEYYL